MDCSFEMFALSYLEREVPRAFWAKALERERKDVVVSRARLCSNFVQLGALHRGSVTEQNVRSTSFSSMISDAG